MAMDQFYITLPSTGSFKTHPTNTLSSFITELHKPIELERTKYEVGLCELQIDAHVSNLDIENEHDCFMVMKIVAEINKVTAYYKRVVRLKQYHYTEAETFVDSLNESMLANDLTKEFRFALTEYNSKTCLKMYSLNSEHDLHDPSFIWFKLAPWYEKHMTMYNPEAGMKYVLFDFDIPKLFPEIGSMMYIYTNIIQHQIVGPDQTKLLRIVNVPTVRERRSTIIFNPTHYVPVEPTRLDIINIDIRDVTGRKVAFTNGSLTVKLHFRRVFN